MMRGPGFTRRFAGKRSSSPSRAASALPIGTPPEVFRCMRDALRRTDRDLPVYSRITKTFFTFLVTCQTQWPLGK